MLITTLVVSFFKDGMGSGNVNLWLLLVYVRCNVPLTQYCEGDKIEKNEMGWACGAYGRGEGSYGVLVGKPEGKRPLGRPRRRWVDNITMEL